MIIFEYYFTLVAIRAVKQRAIKRVKHVVLNIKKIKLYIPYIYIYFFLQNKLYIYHLFTHGIS